MRRAAFDISSVTDLQNEKININLTFRRLRTNYRYLSGKFARECQGATQDNSNERQATCNQWLEELQQIRIRAISDSKKIDADLQKFPKVRVNAVYQTTKDFPYEIQHDLCAKVAGYEFMVDCSAFFVKESKRGGR